jgi:hypothetical protein
MTKTKTFIIGLLKKAPPDFKCCIVWMLDNAFKSPEPPSPDICQIPDTAKNKSIGAKMHPKYKWMERSCFISSETPDQNYRATQGRRCQKLKGNGMAVSR